MIPLYAHRLGRAYGPDNSRTALAAALFRGADGLECDVCLTADGELVLLHDPVAAVRHGPRGMGARANGRRAAPRADPPVAQAPLFVDELLAVAPRDLVLQFDIKFHAGPELATRTVEALAAVLARAAGAASRSSFASAACARAPSLGLPARLRHIADYAPQALALGRAGTASRRVVEHFVLSRGIVAALRRGG